MRFLAAYVAFQDAVSERIGRTVSWLCPAIISILLYEITARRFFLRPSDWAHDLSTYFYGSFCVLAGAYTLRHRSHVRSDVVYSRFPPTVRLGMDLVSGVLTVAALAVFFWLAAKFAYQSWATGEISSKSTWRPVMYPFKATLPAAIGLLLLQQLAETIRVSIALLSPTPPANSTSAASSSPQ